MSEQNENIVILEEPIKRGDTVIEQIEVIKPNAGHLRGIGLAALANADVDALTLLLPRITAPNLTPKDCQSLSLPDLVELAGKVVGFLSPKSAR
ncbi:MULTISPECIES: phage tail assembly protein [Rahnella]|uniref:phage tail assembly protein n=1 Tax=Rahnella TaxID=34037 RepID=UPI00102145DC|nr:MULTISPECIES: phage tail assembly protein [Rahnella]MCX2946615.1 phage tail assembly protein [Rahnella perminowiae]